MSKSLLSLARLALAGAVLALPGLLSGCGGGDVATTGEQASPDLRANLEAESQAAVENAKTTKAKP